MKVFINKVPAIAEEEVIVNCHNPDARWVEYVKSVQTEIQQLSGKNDDDIFNISLKDVYYFETVDNHSFFYTKDKVFESRLKLYEFEEQTKNLMFFKASKSTIVNVKKIKSIKPSLSSRFELTLLNDYKIQVSRHYVAELKKIMGL